MPVVPHAVDLLAGATGAHPTGHAVERSPEPRPRRSGAAGTVTITAVKQIGAPPCPVGARIVIGPGGPLEGTLGCAEFDAEAARIAGEALAAGSASRIPRCSTTTSGTSRSSSSHSPRRPPPRLLGDARRPELLARARPGLSHDACRTADGTGDGGTPRRGRRGPLDASTGWRLDREPMRSTRTTTPPGSPSRSRRCSVRRPGSSASWAAGGMSAPYVESLRVMGFTDDDLARIRSPLGLDLGGVAAGDRPVDRGRIGRGAVRARRRLDGCGERLDRARQAQPQPLGGREPGVPGTQRGAARPVGPAGVGGADIPEDDIHALGDVRGLDVLEYGCGACQFGIRVAMRGARVTGLDSSAPAPSRPDEDGGDGHPVPRRAGRRRADPVRG